MLYQLWNDDRGGIITTELLLVSSVVVTGLLTGLNTFRTSIENEFVELGNKVSQIGSAAEPVRMERPEMIEPMPMQVYLPEDFESLSD